MRFGPGVIFHGVLYVCFRSFFMGLRKGLSGLRSAHVFGAFGFQVMPFFGTELQILFVLEAGGLW